MTGIENVRMAAIQLQTSAPVLVHRFAVEGKPFETWEEAEAYVVDLRAKQGSTWGSGVSGYSWVGMRAGRAGDPSGAPQPVFAFAAWVGKGVDWKLAPPGALEAVVEEGQFAGWVMGEG